MTSDDQLIQSILEGQQQAFRQLVDKYQNQMFSVCLSILKTKDEAQEATQDTFIKIYNSLNSYNAESKFSSWAYKIAYRTSLDYIRKRKKTTALEDVDYALMGTVPSSDEHIVKSELNMQLLNAMKGLNDDEAGILRMFYLEEMTIKELEVITGLSKSNIKVKLFRGRKRLAELIRSDHSEIESYLEN